MVRSKTYQLSAQPNEHNAIDRQNFSHFYPKRLQAEVLLDSIDTITGASTSFADLPIGTRAVALPDNSYNTSSAFLKVFGRPDAASVCECERVQASSLAQSLHLINSSDVKSKLATANGRADTLSKSEEEGARGHQRNLSSRLFPPADRRRTQHRGRVSRETAHRFGGQTARSEPGEASGLRGPDLGADEHQGISLQSLIS